MTDSMRHRLAAVLFADIVEYSTLAARRPEEAMAVVERLQIAARAAVERHEGRVVKFLGDGVLAEFSSSASAVRAADALRTEFRALAVDAGAAPAELRIGVHLGEVAVSEDGDVYGEGVNVAARIQTAAAPGQLLVSEDVRRQLHARRGYRFVAAGRHRLKGTEEPMDLYAVEPADVASPEPGSRPPPAAGWRIARPALAAVAGLALVALAAALLLRGRGDDAVVVPTEAVAGDSTAALPPAGELPAAEASGDPVTTEEPAAAGPPAVAPASSPTAPADSAGVEPDRRPPRRPVRRAAANVIRDRLEDGRPLRADPPADSSRPRRRP